MLSVPLNRMDGFEVLPASLCVCMFVVCMEASLKRETFDGLSIFNMHDFFNHRSVPDEYEHPGSEQRGALKIDIKMICVTYRGNFLW
jgi:hypothetical protein